MTVWFITGASRGFGRELAAAALEDGDQVIATARDPRAVLQALPEAGDALLAARLDVTDEPQAAKAVAAGVERFGRIDVLVNNAGYGLFGKLTEAIEAGDGRQPGDPVKAAAAVRQLAAASQPPLRLHLGSDCVRLVEGKLATVTEELDHWRDLALSTDFPRT